MEIRTLQSTIVDALEDVKGQDIRVFDTTGMTDLFDRVVICSGTSNRQTRALAMNVREKVKDSGGDVISMEGEDTGEWVLVDLGDVVVHIMQPAIRQYYNLEELWGQKLVDVKAEVKAAAKAKTKTAAKKPSSKKPSGTAPAKAAATVKTAAKKPAAKKPADKPADTSAKKAAKKPAKKPAAK